MHNFDYYMEMILRGSAIVNKAEEEGIIPTKDELRKKSYKHVDKEVEWDRGKIYINPSISRIKQIAFEFEKYYYDNSVRGLIYNGNFYIGDQRQIHEDLLNYVDSIHNVRERSGVNIYDIYIGKLSFWQYKISHNTFYLSESYSSEINKIYIEDTIKVSGTKKNTDNYKIMKSSDVIDFFQKEVDSINSIYKYFNFVFKIIN